MTTMETVTALVADIETLTAGCLGCGEPVPEDSLSDLFCARPNPSYPQCHPDCWMCCEDPVITCQTRALDRMGHEPDEIYDAYDELQHDRSSAWARWWPGIEDGERAPRIPHEDVAEVCSW